MAKNGVKVYLDVEHEKLLEEITSLKKLGSISASGLVRFIILDYYELLTTKNPSEAKEVKLHAMGKDISILLNLVCALIASNEELGKAGHHVRNEDVLLYWQAQKYVEGIIDQRKTGHWKHPKPPTEIQEILQEKVVDAKTLEELENKKRDLDFEKMFGFDPSKSVME